MQNIIVVIVMVLQILLSGGNANGNQNYNNMNWLQLMALMGSTFRRIGIKTVGTKSIRPLILVMVSGSSMVMVKDLRSVSMVI